MTGMEFQRGIFFSFDNLTLLTTVSGITLQYNDSTVESEMTYFYAESPVNDIGEGNPSNSLEITIPEAGSTAVMNNCCRCGGSCWYSSCSCKEKGFDLINNNIVFALKAI